MPYKTRISILIISLVLIWATQAATALGQDGDPSVWLYSLKKIKPFADSSPFIGEAWLKTGNKKSVAFLIAYPKNRSDPTWFSSLYSIAITHKGRASKPKKLWTGEKMNLLDIKAVWLNNNSAAPAPEDKGLVFVSYNTDPGRGAAKVAVAQFDSNGELLSPFSEIAHINAPDGEEVADCYLAASQGEESIALLYCASYYLYDYGTYIGQRGTEAFFMEVGLDGQPKSVSTGRSPAAHQLRLNANGKLQECIPFRPYWTGKRWLLPVSILRFTVVAAPWGGERAEVAGCRLLVLNAQPKNGSLVKLRLMEIARIDNGEMLNFTRVAILPGALQGGAPKAGNNLLLAYGFGRAIAESRRQLETYDIEYRLQPISDRGKKSGPVSLIEFPKWNHSITYDPDGSLSASIKALSYPTQLDDGTLLISLCRSARWMTAGGTMLHENNFEFYSIDPETGILTVLARRDSTYPGLFFQMGVMVMGGRYCILQDADMLYADWSFETFLYFTRF
ncbi:MAG TPA: hypothetical protein VMX35_06295 [Acidobacteriota bacterium]|nr:hypothetical protein [Acidobacteriota bacterium]